MRKSLPIAGAPVVASGMPLDRLTYEAYLRTLRRRLRAVAHDAKTPAISAHRLTLL